MWIELNKKKKEELNKEVHQPWNLSSDFFLYQVFFIAAIDFFEE